MPILWGQVESLAHKNRGLLIGVAVAALGLYICLAVRYPLRFSLTDPRASWASIVEPSGVNAIGHLAIYLGLTLLYLAALRLLVPAPGKNGALFHRQILLIFTVWLVCSGVLMFVAPAGESHDIFDYLFRGRMITEYQVNPLTDVPDSLDISTPYSRYLAWRNNVDTYGPVWEVASAAIASSVHRVTSWLGWWDASYPVCPASQESCRLLIVYITGYRLLAISLSGVSGLLIISLVGYRRAALAPLALAAWLWSPLTLITSAVGGHNDALMLVLVLLSWWLLHRQHPFWALMVLIFAAHVKLTAFIWLPAYAVWIVWRHGWRQALKIGMASVVSGLALSWLMYAPFGGWQTLPRMLQERSAFIANSLWQVLEYLLINLWGWNLGSAHQLSIGLPNSLFAVGSLLIPLWMFNIRPNRWRSAPILLKDANLILWRTMIAVGMFYLLIGSFWFQHWYILWVLAPAVLLPESQLTRFLLPWLAFGAMSSNVVMDFLLTTTLKNGPPIWNYVLSIVIIWGPVLIASGICILARRWNKNASLAQA